MVTSDTRIAVIGQGYVGLPLAIAFVEAGLDVAGVDRSASRVAEPGGATSTQRLPPSSPNGTSARSSQPRVCV